MQAQIDVIKANKEMAKAMMPQFAGMSDEMVEMQLNMLTPAMMRGATKMTQENPDLIKQAMNNQG